VSDQFDDVDAEFIDIFRDEANERLDHMVNTLLALESGTADADAIDALFRDAHTIKGGAGMVGLDGVRDLAHTLEDVLAVLREAGQFPTELTATMLRATDALRGLVCDGAAPPAGLQDELKAALGPASAEPAAAAKAPAKRARASKKTATKATAVAEAPAVEEIEVVPEPAPLPEVPPAAVIEPAIRQASERRTVRVPAEKLDRLLDLVGETVLHRRRLEHALGAEETSTSQLITDELGLGERLLGDLKDAAINMRTLPLASIVGPLPRAVRDVAAEQGKEVELVVKGAETELDRVILESLSEPLVHLLRNSVGHGIETPAERVRARKPGKGRVELRAETRGGRVEITVSDDGRGVSRETLEEARRVGSLVDVLARAGYSTASEVTELSGRGVGLDAVKKHVESFGGTMEVRSEPGKGTSIVLQLPLALALLEVLLFVRAGTVFGLPLPTVEEAVSIGDTFSLQGRPALELRGGQLPLFDVAELVGCPHTPLPNGAPALVVSAGGRRIAAACDTLLGEEEVVVKPLGPLFRVDGYLGASILGDGRIALLLDAMTLTRGQRRVSAALPSVAAVDRGSSEEDVDLAPKVLVVEDSFTVRELQRGILEAASYRVVTARDGREALEVLSRDDEIALVITDIEMPEMDGFALTQAIRADAVRSSLPIVVVTSLGSEEDRRRGIDAGADAYMVKRSFDQQAMLETVERLLGR
jgi:two-component system, chemotaxis family, sensor kinase CheA